jgi:hypothetical protein
MRQQIRASIRRLARVTRVLHGDMLLLTLPCVVYLYRTAITNKINPHEHYALLILLICLLQLSLNERQDENPLNLMIDLRCVDTVRDNSARLTHAR